MKCQHDPLLEGSTMKVHEAGSCVEIRCEVCELTVKELIQPANVALVANVYPVHKCGDGWAGVFPTLQEAQSFVDAKLAEGALQAQYLILPESPGVWRRTWEEGKIRQFRKRLEALSAEFGVVVEAQDDYDEARVKFVVTAEMTFGEFAKHEI